MDSTAFDSNNHKPNEKYIKEIFKENKHECEYYYIRGHKKEIFYKLVGYPQDTNHKKKKEMKKKRKNNRILSTNQKGNVANHTTVIPEIHLHYHQYTNFSSCHHSRSGVTNTEITQQSYEHSINCKCNRILL